MTETTDPQADRGADADTVARRAAQVITTMGADIRALTSQRDRYRSAWCSARERAQAYGEGILRVVKDREAYQGWLREAEERVPAAPSAPADRAALLREAADICDEAGAVYTSKALNDHADGAYALMERFLRKADEAEYVATPCSFGACEPGGEPCDTHERLMAHAEGDHDLCEPDCGTSPSRMAGEAQQPETQGEDRAAIIAEILPTWEAVYEPGNVSDYLIGYANSEAAAKGAAEAWMRSQAEVTGRLEWVPQRPLDGYDAETELVERHDDGIDTGPGITVRRRVEPAAVSQPGKEA